MAKVQKWPKIDQKWPSWAHYESQFDLDNSFSQDTVELCHIKWYRAITITPQCYETGKKAKPHKNGHHRRIMRAIFTKF